MLHIVLERGSATHRSLPSGRASRICFGTMWLKVDSLMPAKPDIPRPHTALSTGARWKAGGGRPQERGWWEPAAGNVGGDDIQLQHGPDRREWVVWRCISGDMPRDGRNSELGAHSDSTLHEFACGCIRKGLLLERTYACGLLQRAGTMCVPAP